MLRKDADPAIPIYKQAKAEYAKLQQLATAAQRVHRQSHTGQLSTVVGWLFQTR